jgi:O-antigen/teichoic acid export membrane protein
VRPDSEAPTGIELPATSTIKRLVFSASVWTFAGALVGQFSSFIIFAILARLLSPYEFGLVAFLALFVDLVRGTIVGGIPEALIQRAVWSKSSADTAFWLNIVSTTLFIGGVLGWILLVPQSAQIPVTAWLFLALSFTLMVDAARAVHEAHLRRNFGYKLLAIRTALASIIGGVTGIISALLGLGVWSLVIQRVVTSLAQTITVWGLADYRPGLAFHQSELGPLLSFSSRVMVGRLVAQINGRLPDFIIGVVAGPAALGLFRVGSRSLNFLVQTLMAPLQTTTLSAFARLNGDNSVSRAYARFTQLSAVLIFPAFMGSAAVAPDFIRVFVGEKWSGGEWIMVALSFTVFARALLHFFQPAMQAIGKPQKAIRPEVTRLFSGALIVTAASFGGPLAAAIGDTVRRYVALPQCLRILREELGLEPARLVRGVAAPFLCSTAMCGLVVLLQMTWLIDWSPHWRLAICIVAGAAIYPALLAIFARTFLADIAASARYGLPTRLRSMLDRSLELLLISRSNTVRQT